MKAMIDREELVRAIERASQATQKDHSLYSQVLVQSFREKGDKPSTVQLSTTTGLISIRTAVQCSVDETVELTVNAQRLLQSARAMPEGETVELKTTKKDLVVTAGRRKHVLPIITGELYQPTIPSLGEDAKLLELERGTLKKMIQKLSFAVPGDAMPSHNGIVMRHHEGSLDFGVLGRHMFARAHTVFDGSGDWVVQMLPEIVLAALTDLCQPGEERIELLYDESHLFCRTPETLLVTVLPPMAVLEFEQLFGRFISAPVGEVQLTALLQSMAACKMESTTGLNVILDPAGEAKLFIDGKDGKSEDFVAVADAQEWAFECSYAYLHSTLKSCGSPTVRLRRCLNGLMVTDGAGFLAIIALMNANGAYNYDVPDNGVVYDPRTGGDGPQLTEKQKDDQQQANEEEANDSPKHRQRKKKASKKTAKKPAKAGEEKSDE